MNQEQKDKGWQAKSKVQVDIQNKIDADISNLNDDDSFKPVDENAKEPLTEEEVKSIRRKLFFLVGLVGIVLITFVIALFFNPFTGKDNKETPVKKPEANINKETASITEFNDGDVTLNNKEIKELISEILFVQYDYYENNTNTIFEKENVYINNLTNKDKLFLASKTSDFDSLIKKRITIETLCDTGVNISKKEIDTILEDRFNTSVEVYEPFTYNIYIKDKYEKTVRFTYENDKYIGTCYTSTNTIETSTQQKVVSATKNKKQLYIDVKVVFVNQTGIYKDPSFTTLITTGNESFEEYIEKGNTYRYTYDLSGTSYSLTNVSLLK